MKSDESLPILERFIRFLLIQDGRRKDTLYTNDVLLTIHSPLTAQLQFLCIQCHECSKVCQYHPVHRYLHLLFKSLLHCRSKVLGTGRTSLCIEDQLCCIDMTYNVHFCNKLAKWHSCSNFLTTWSLNSIINTVNEQVAEDVKVDTWSVRVELVILSLTPWESGRERMDYKFSWNLITLRRKTEERWCRNMNNPCSITVFLLHYFVTECLSIWKFTAASLCKLFVAMDVSNTCIICKCPLAIEVVAQVGEKGIRTMLLASEKRHDDLHLTLGPLSSIAVHVRCRKSYTDPRSFTKAAMQNEANWRGQRIHSQNGRIWFLWRVVASAIPRQTA